MKSFGLFVVLLFLVGCSAQLETPTEVAESGSSAVLVCVGMSNAHQECGDFKQKVEGVLRDELNPSFRVVNCAVGGHALERWNNASYDDVLWGACKQQLSALGVSSADEVHVWHKAATQFVRDENNELLSVDEAKKDFYRELTVFSYRLAEEMPFVEVVHVSGRSYGGFATRPDRGEPLAKETNEVVRRWVADHPEVRGVAYVQGPYLWAQECSQEQESNTLCYTRTDYQQDGIHPATGARNKISRVLHEYFSAFNWYSG